MDKGDCLRIVPPQCRVVMSRVHQGGVNEGPSHNLARFGRWHTEGRSEICNPSFEDKGEVHSPRKERIHSMWHHAHVPEQTGGETGDGLPSAASKLPHKQERRVQDECSRRNTSDGSPRRANKETRLG